MSEYGTSNIVLFDEKIYIFPYNITSVLVFSVRQDFNGCDCADHPVTVLTIKDPGGNCWIHSYV